MAGPADTHAGCISTLLRVLDGMRRCYYDDSALTRSQARESLKSALLERDTTDITRAGELGMYVGAEKCASPVVC